MKTISSTILSVSLILILGSCGSSNSQGQSSSGELTEREEGVKLKQYMVHGKSLYQTYCSNCHGKEGEGLAKLFPPLAKSDYLMSDLKRASCIIKNGQNGEVVVNGVSYNQPMPAQNGLDPIEIAEIITYISNSWGNTAGLTSSKDVSTWLADCDKE